MWIGQNYAWRRGWVPGLFAAVFWLLAALPSAHAEYLRIVNYNIEADTDGNTAPNPGLSTVLEAIGTQNVNGVARPIDILALEETTSNTATVAPIVTALNGYYGTSATYAMASYQGMECNNDPTTGNTALTNLSGTITASQTLSALITASDHLPVVVDYAVTLTPYYTKVIAATGITYMLQVSGDLHNWNGGTGYTVAVSATNNADNATQTVVVRDAVAMGAGGRPFMRLGVTRP